jgi:tRNA-splicing ligase RtcB (3'-phosphate/5'-hydroxy nucleic acid ligase)
MCRWSYNCVLKWIALVLAVLGHGQRNGVLRRRENKMISVISSEKIPIKMWLEDVEESAREQIRNLANLPFAFHHVAIMPDCHSGYGMPIGGVLATEGVIIPNAVGVDIGCGMRALCTNIKEEELSKDVLLSMIEKIKELIPVGFNHHEEPQNYELMPCTDFLNFHKHIVGQQWESALHQLGTLGGGNHFIEIQKDGKGYIWIMIHSGSRNLGKKVADYYNKLAIELNKKWYSSVPKNWELAFLPIDIEEYKDYVKEMNYCVSFAQANRRLMMDVICLVFMEFFKDRDIDPLFSFTVDVAHNYARMENHYGKNVMIHRKGATSANQGQIGIIPGSQGTKSYIVKGKGNIDSFKSCSHGAGRCMGRKRAKEVLNLEEEIRILEEQGIIHSIKLNEDLEEATSAYKDISQVMENQKDLVEILHELTPLAVIKG